MATRVLLVEQHRELGVTLRKMLENEPDLSVVGEAGSAPEAVEAARRCHPDVALVDGLESVASIHLGCPDLAVLVLSMHNDERYAARALETGARGYLLKQSVERYLPAAIRKVSAGGRYLSPELGAGGWGTV